MSDSLFQVRKFNYDFQRWSTHHYCKEWSDALKKAEALAGLETSNGFPTVRIERNGEVFAYWSEGERLPDSDPHVDVNPRDFLPPVG